MLQFVKTFFWACAGATLPLIQSEDCKTEHSKYVGIGAAVLSTGVLAGASASYAFFTVFYSIPWSVAFGIFWGLMIFNLDRYIVVSIKKKDASADDNLRARLSHFGKELGIALPRVALAALLAVVIAKPLELRLFEKEILIEMNFLRNEKQQEFDNSVFNPLAASEGQQNAERINTLTRENQAYQTEIDNASKRYEDKKRIAIEEAEGTSGTGHKGEGGVFKMKQEDLAAAKTNYETIKSRNDPIIASNLSEIQQRRQVQSQQVENNRQQSVTTDGLATRLEAFSRLSAKNAVVRYANWFIMLIIMILELAPILTKVFASYGPYDRLVEMAERKVYLEKQSDMETLEAEIRRRRDSYSNTQKALLDVQDIFLKEVREGTQTGRERSTIERTEWEEAKSALIEHAIRDLHHLNGKGNGKEYEH